jgi:hypothetical protein
MKFRSRLLRMSITAGVLVIGCGLLASACFAISSMIPYTDPDQLFDAPPTSWLLLAPPLSISGLTVDTQAGLASWIPYGRYNTLKDCASTVQLMLNGARQGELPPQASNSSLPPFQSSSSAGRSNMGGAGNGNMPSGQMAGSGIGTTPSAQMAGTGMAGTGMAGTGMSGMSGTTGAANMPPIQPVAQITPQQLRAAYCFADNDRRLTGMIVPPAPPAPIGQQPLEQMPGQSGQLVPSNQPGM